MGYGWLPRRIDIVRDETWFGIPLKLDLPTRWEEFSFVKEVLSGMRGKVVLDAGCGFEVGVHIMPQITAKLGWKVLALDKKKQIRFEPEAKITRIQGNLFYLPIESESVDVCLSISVLEHLDVEEMFKAVDEMHRVLKLGGAWIVTMDCLSPHLLIDKFSDKFLFGEEIPFRSFHLEPAVSWIVAQRI